MAQICTHAKRIIVLLKLYSISNTENSLLSSFSLDIIVTEARFFSIITFRNGMLPSNSIFLINCIQCCLVFGPIGWSQHEGCCLQYPYDLNINGNPFLVRCHGANSERHEYMTVQVIYISRLITPKDYSIIHPHSSCLGFVTSIQMSSSTSFVFSNALCHHCISSHSLPLGAKTGTYM